MSNKEPKTVAWLKKRIKHLPDDYPIYFRDEWGKRQPIHEIGTDKDRQETILISGILNAKLESLLMENQKILAIKMYKDRTGASLVEAKEYVEELEKKLGL